MSIIWSWRGRYCVLCCKYSKVYFFTYVFAAENCFESLICLVSCASPLQCLISSSVLREEPRYLHFFHDLSPTYICPIFQFCFCFNHYFCQVQQFFQLDLFFIHLILGKKYRLRFFIYLLYLIYLYESSSREWTKGVFHNPLL